jgi:uncharacterized protein YecE (DUF72 family)
VHGMTWLGVAGWDYPDWSGVVYPASAKRGFDRLAWVARFVDVVEINSSFYRPVAPKTSEAWVRRVAARPGFRFTAKAHRSWTHEPWEDPGPAVSSTLAGLRPLREAGVLGALLVQFPQSFHWTPENRSRLGRLLDAVGDWPVAIEVRHASWDDDRAAAWARERRAGWCVVDQPRIRDATAPPRPRVTSELAYLRLHGRNTARWFDPAAGRDARYDYLYSMDELRPLAEAARTMGSTAKALYVIANNHFRGQALANALQLKHLIQGIEPEAPEELLAAYPQLRGLAAAVRERLF